MVQIAGIGLSGFRSFRSGDLQLLAPLGRVNLLAGQNNSGKSNVLRFAQTVLAACAGANGAVASLETVTGLELPVGHAPGGEAVELAVALTVGDAEISAMLEPGLPRLQPHYVQALRDVWGSPALRLTKDDLLWFRFRLEPDNATRSTVRLSEQQLGEVLGGLHQHNVQALGQASSVLTSNSGDPRSDLERVLSRFNPFAVVPPVETIQAFRQVREGGGPDASSYNGEGLIEALAQLERPDITKLDDQQRFEAINRFVRTVLDDPTVNIQIPHDRRTIHVHRNGLVLPLENLGTGIHQVVILAAAATLLTNHLVCMEEPEIHLHPILQRKLLHYLATETSNQYLIATHSAHMLDAELASIFHVTLTDSGTRVRFAAHPKDQAAICADLGYRPSDLVQANAVVWVEGPSDRIYLRHWIKLIDPTLVEGVHYSIMFYGGRLLNHLTADDPDVEDFISLRRFNRHISILIDSDKTGQRKHINETKKRIVIEFDRGPGFAWITKGYTIENYLPPSVLSEAIGAEHPGATVRWTGDLYQNPLSSEMITGRTSAVDKVAVARRCVDLWDETTGWTQDLKRQVTKTVDFIREANGIAPRE